MIGAPPGAKQAVPRSKAICLPRPVGRCTNRAGSLRRLPVCSAAMAVLIVGGAGYVGSQTAKAMAREGLVPVVFDNLVYGHEWAVRWGPLVHGDLADAPRIAGVLREYDIRSVVHFAAYTYVGESVTAPRKYFANNVVNTIHLLDAMVDAGVRDIVFSSSCATYGDPKELPLRESHPQDPTSPYGESKLMVEKLLRWYRGAYGLRFAALRYFNAAGADPDGELGESHDPEAHLIPLAIASAVGHGAPLSIFGTDYDTPDGTAIRDYIHVVDLARAHCLALRHLSENDGPLRLNLGTGRGHSVREIIAMVERVTGGRVTAREAARRPGDPPRLVADPREAERVLGWKAEHSDLSTIVEHAVRWHRSRRATG
jgi:UDP-glucose-4-epimerase GalE